VVAGERDRVLDLLDHLGVQVGTVAEDLAVATGPGADPEHLPQGGGEDLTCGLGGHGRRRHALNVASQ
jgi:hypothetical protein